MGYNITKFNIVPGENEQIDVVVKLQKEIRSIVHGVVLDEKDKPVRDAVVKLFLVKNGCDSKKLEPLTHTFTDEYGQFLFGPLCPHVKYLIKVWVNHVKIREIVVKPEECHNPCHELHECDDNGCDDNDCFDECEDFQYVKDEE